jgi:hypothetical protein
MHIEGQSDTNLKQCLKLQGGEDCALLSLIYEQSQYTMYGKSEINMRIFLGVLEFTSSALGPVIFAVRMFLTID